MNRIGRQSVRAATVRERWSVNRLLTCAALKNRSLTLAALLLLPSLTFAQRDIRNIPDPDPEIERKSFQVADGFEVNLFAADPMLAKPIQMNFDPMGRLWVAASEVYPQIKPGQKANDKILILEDTNGDGKADKTTVFADGLLFPTGIEPGDGGVYVGASTDLLHLSDTNNDGKADRTRVVLSGFGTEDTHHMIHTLRWGPDGLLYMNQSIYIHSHIETPHGPRRLLGGGIWHLRPETLELGVFARGWVNAWGHHHDRWGQSFVTDGAGGEGINYAIPGAYYFTAVGATRLVQGLNPGSPKYCGMEVVSGRHLPDDWQGNIITNDFRGHRVCRFVIKDDGAGFAAELQPDLIKTAHPAFRPIDVKMGPDGAIYIADWYNPIIQHGEVDFRDPRRDVTHGRIWRVTAKNRPLVPRPQLVDAPTDKLLDHLKDPEEYTRRQAKRVLKERGAKVLPELAKWVAQLDPFDDDYHHQLLEALWTHQALDAVEPKLLAKVLALKYGHPRAAAVRVISHWYERLPNAMELLTTAVTDENPRVRLEAVRALGCSQDSRAVEMAMRVLDHPMDKFLDYALWLTCRDLESVWMPELQKGTLTFGGNARHLVFGLQAIGNKSVVKPLMELVRAGKIPVEQEEAVLAMIATFGEAKDLGAIFEAVVSPDALPANQRAALLTALDRAVKQRQVRPEGNFGRLLPLLQSESEPVRTAALRLVGSLKLEPARAELTKQVDDAKTNDAVRQAALDGLVAFGGVKSRETLEALCKSDRSFLIRSQALGALAALDLAAAIPMAADQLAQAKAGDDPSFLVQSLSQHKNAPKLLAKALADQKVNADVAKLAIRAVRASGRELPELLDAFTRAGSLTTGAKSLTNVEMQELVQEVATKGNPARGEAIYRRAELNCLKCHAIAGAGGLVGPDLVSIGASAQVDYLIDSLLQPNKAVKENYHAMIVGTKAGKIFTGIKVRETQSELTLRNAEDQEVTIPTKDIDERGNARSLMPDGLTDPLTRAELIDLVRFLSELGKVGPYAVNQARVVRRWQVLSDTPTARRVSAPTDDSSLLWTSVYSQVSGDLPLDAVPNLAGKGFIRCSLEVTSPGAVRLSMNEAKGLKLYLGNKLIESRREFTLELQAGTLTLTLEIDLRQRKEGIRLELLELPDSPARVRIIGGK